MKTLMVVVLAVLFISCFETTVPSERMSASVFGYQLKILVIDSCEYIALDPGMNRGILTHKGNCKYCAARNNK